MWDMYLQVTSVCQRQNSQHCNGIWLPPATWTWGWETPFYPGAPKAGVGTSVWLWSVLTQLESSMTPWLCNQPPGGKEPLQGIDTLGAVGSRLSCGYFSVSPLSLPLLSPKALFGSMELPHPGFFQMFLWDSALHSSLIRPSPMWPQHHSFQAAL